MTICFATLMCHAPIVVPTIGGTRAPDCAETTRAMRAAARELVVNQPDLVVLVSPHAPRRRTSWGLTFDARVSGDFARFDHPELAVTLHGSRPAAEALAAHARADGLAVESMSGDDLDHGSMVPLWFLAEAGYRDPLLVVALPYDDTETEERFGRAIARAAATRNERWAVVASGDMSHRLTRHAPAGFHPRAHEFDEAFVSAIRDANLRRATSPDPELRELAGEDVIQSTAVAFGAIGDASHGFSLLSYEGPFGVGYCEAILHTDRSSVVSVPPPAFDESLLTRIARDAIESSLTKTPYVAPALPAAENAPHAVFVTLRDAHGELRGCIGRTAPLHATLAEEIADCAVGAAERDPRFDRVTRSELDGLSIEVSILESPVPVKDVSELDPHRYGVVVSTPGRRGVLLPDVPGVESVEQQLSIALRKGEIRANEPHRVEKFGVRKVVERASAEVRR